MEITILDKTLDKVGVIEVFDSLIWNDRYSRHGDFELLTKASRDYVLVLRQDYFLTIPESEHLMIIESIELKTDIEDGNKFLVKGRSLESILFRRIIWKQTILSGNLQLGIKQLLDENVISPEDPDRKITNLIFEMSDDTAITSLSVDQQFFGEELYVVIQWLCENSGIGFKITLSDDKFIFKLYAGVDRSYDQLENPFVAFSPDLDNLTNTNYYHSKEPFKTIALVAGEGEGADRITTQIMLPDGAGTGLDRREKYTDARDVSTIIDGEILSLEEYYTLLAQRGFLSLLDSQQISSFDGQIDSTTNYTYGVDFFIGDIVQVANEYGLQSKSRVTSLIISEDLSGINIFPNFETME